MRLLQTIVASMILWTAYLLFVLVVTKPAADRYNRPAPVVCTDHYCGSVSQ